MSWCPLLLGRGLSALRSSMLRQRPVGTTFCVLLKPPHLTESHLRLSSSRQCMSSTTQPDYVIERQLQEMINDNMAVTAIALQLGWDEASVHRRIARLAAQNRLFTSQGASRSPKDGQGSMDTKLVVPPLRKAYSGRVVLNHSTHCDDLIPALTELAEYEGVRTITPGRLRRVTGHVAFLILKIAGGGGGGGDEQEGGDEGGGSFRLSARRGTTWQEVFVTCEDSFSRSMLEQAVQEVLAGYGGGKRI